MDNEVAGIGAAGIPTERPQLRARQRGVLLEFDLLDVPADPELEAVARVAASVVSAPIAMINLLDTERVCQAAAFGFPVEDVGREQSLCNRASLIGGVVSSEDCATDLRFADLPWVDGRWASVKRYASAPLVVDDLTIGTLCVFDEEQGPVTAEQLARLADLAEVVIALLERRRDNRRIEAARVQLADAHDEVIRTQAFDRALLDAIPVGIVAAGPDRRLSLLNEVSRQWHGSDAQPGLDPDDLAQAYDLYEADGSTWLATDRVPLVRVFEEGRVTGAEIVIRRQDADARVVSCSGSEVRDPTGRFLGAVVAMADVTAQRELEEQLRTAAAHDVLTGLPNRSLLVDRLEHALAGAVRGSGHVAVLYCDLDGFKAVNDEYGHATGDEVLVTAAARLAGAVRPGDTVARIGGDEFVLLCAEVRDAAAATAIADRVVAAMAEPVVSAAGVHRVGVSIGVALSSRSSTPETIITAADEEMYLVKRARPGPSRRG